MSRCDRDPRRRRRDVTLLAGGLMLAVLAGCGPTPSPSGPVDAASPEPTPGAAVLSQAEVQRSVDDLATLGIETRVRPSDAAPITAVAGRSSAVRLLRIQMRNLALERKGGGGTMGADLDALTSAAGGGPVSSLIAGWAASAATPAAAWASSLLGDNASADPLGVVVPTLVLIAFLADVTSGSGEVSSTPSIQLASSSDCAEISAYLADALDGIVDSAADPPAWLKQLIDQYAPQYEDDPGLLQRTIGALALVSYATSMARPWTVKIVADPEAIAYGILGEEPVGGEVDLTVLSGADVFGEDVADCASLADAQLASVPVEGSSVVWDSSGMTVHATDVAGQSQVDGLGVAALTYQTASESHEDAVNGDPATATMRVEAWVDRAEMAALGAVVKSILLGDSAGSPAGATVKALYDAMDPTLTTVMRPSGSASIDVAYHTPRASPEPSVAESQLTGTWIGTWAIDPPYADVVGEFSMELVQNGESFSGTVEITNTDCSNGTVEGTVDGTSVTFGWVLTPQPVQFTGTLDGSSMSGSWAAAACSDASISLTGTWEARKVS